VFRVFVVLHRRSGGKKRLNKTTVGRIFKQGEMESESIAPFRGPNPGATSQFILRATARPERPY
jgi:hypothetical protein